jgi:hypothetical protein
MAAHRAQASQPLIVPLGGVLLAFALIVTICALAIAAADSSKLPSIHRPAPTGIIALTPDDPGAANPVPASELGR